MASKISFANLKKWNLAMAGLHGAQAVLMTYLAKWDVVYPINVGFLKFDLATKTLKPAVEQIGEIALVLPVIIFLALSSLFHLFIATAGNRLYESDLARGMNRFRWVEYSFSASMMIIAIALLTGIYDATSLLMMFSLVAVMNLCGLVMEVHNQATKQTNWLSYWVGCLAGIIPWIVIAIYFAAASSFGADEGQIPSFVYWIYVSIFAFFNCFAINMVLQYKKIGPWKDYIFGEKMYIILSLVAKSALAWQVFAGSLRP